MIDDATLLARYAQDRSEEAFAELVRRHLTLVYSSALRRTDGDAHRAQDVAQIVFTALARDAAALSGHPALTRWLHTATRNATIDLLRTERRRRHREEKAHPMENIASSPESPADWEQLRPVLDDVMEELEDRDREAVLLRFFEDQPFASVATALRLSEDAARKRVDRALDKLGALLQRRGIASTGGALAMLLANEVAVAAPASVAASITSGAMAGAGVAAGVSAVGTAGIFLMSTAKIVTGITAVVALAAISLALYEVKRSRESHTTAAVLQLERDQLQARLSAIERRVHPVDRTLGATPKAAPPPADAPARAAKATSSQTEWAGKTEQLVEYMISQVLDESCNEFFAQHAVDAATRKKAIKVLTHETLAGMDIGTLSVREGGLSPGAISQLLAAGRSKTAEQLKEILGVERGTTFLEFIAARESKVESTKAAGNR